MPRHVPDDFSFLPTVDTTDEELIELAEQRKAAAWQAEEAPPVGSPMAPAPADPAAAEEPPIQHVHVPPSRAAQMEQAVNDLLNREVEYEEPAVQDLPPEQQDGQELWQEFWQGKTPPPLGVAVEEDPNRFESGVPTVTMVLSPAEVAARLRAEAERAAGTSTAAARPASKTAPLASPQPQMKSGVPAQAETPEPEDHEPLSSSLPADLQRARAERGTSGKRGLLETPPVSFGGAASARDKSGRRKEAAEEKLGADSTSVPAKTAAATASERPRQQPPPLPPEARRRTGQAEMKRDDAGAKAEPGLVGGEGGEEVPVTPFTAPKPQAEEQLDPDQLKKLRWRKLVEKAGLNTLGWSVAAHIVLLILAAMWGLKQMEDSPVDFLPGGGSAQSQAAEAALTNKIQHKKNPWLKAKPQMRKVTVQSISSDIVLPEMPMDALDLSSITNRMDVKASTLGGMTAPMGAGAAGAGGGFGAGIGRGGKFSFVGQTALGRRVVFVVDVSGSMSAIGTGEDISRFDLLKKELIKSVSMIPMNTQYQILFFSDFAWPHDQVDSRNLEALTKYRWEIDPDNYKKVKIPPYRFISATPFTIRDTVDIIQKSDNPGGTNWGSGLLMALNASPKPDVIFFMTDGLQSDAIGWVDVVTEENKRRLPMTTIHTSAMQQPDAARELDDLARRNNGKFTVVLGDGKIVKGEDFFKGKR